MSGGEETDIAARRDARVLVEAGGDETAVPSRGGAFASSSTESSGAVRDADLCLYAPFLELLLAVWTA